MQVLGLDVGTQSVKGLVLDVPRGAVVARAARPLELLPGLPPGAAEQHPDAWERAVGEVCRELLAAPDVRIGELFGVGVSGQQHGAVLLDAEGRVVRPAKLWCDTATAREARELSERLGRHVPTGFTASKLTWVARHEPDNWARTRLVLLPHDLVNLRLTGRAVMECGDASGTGLLDPRTRTFDPAALEATAPGLAERLPPLIGPRAEAGRVDAAGARLTGLPEGLPVAPGGGDNMLSAIGSGAVRPGVVTVSLGTSGTVFCHSPVPVIDPEGLVAPFCDSTGGWLPLLCVMNLTGVTEGVRELTGLDHGQLTTAAGTVPDGCDGLLWLPYLAGERVPDLPDATGTLLGMRAAHLRPGVLYRAALEGTAWNLAWGVERMRALGIEVRRVHLVGGAARNRLWRSILADRLGATVLPLEEPESAALGGALQALWCASGPDADLSALVKPWVRAAAEPLEPTLPEDARRAGLAHFVDAVHERHGDA